MQSLNEITQGTLIQSTAELQSRIRERNDLQLKFLDSDHETTNLQYRQSTLNEQAQKFLTQISSLPGAGTPANVSH
jgi:hypothetical protein